MHEQLFFNETFGYPGANSRPLTRKQPGSHDVQTAIILADLVVTGSLVARLGPMVQRGLNREPSNSQSNAPSHCATLPRLFSCLIMT